MHTVPGLRNRNLARLAVRLARQRGQHAVEPVLGALAALLRLRPALAAELTVEDLVDLLAASRAVARASYVLHE